MFETLIITLFFYNTDSTVDPKTSVIMRLQCTSIKIMQPEHNIQPVDNEQLWVGLLKKYRMVTRNSIESFLSRFPFSQATFEINDIWKTIKNEIQPGQSSLTLGSEDLGHTKWTELLPREFSENIHQYGNILHRAYSRLLS